MKVYRNILSSAILAAAVVGCGGQPPASAPAPAPAPAATPAPAPAPAAGKNVVLPASDEIQIYKHEEAKIELAIPAKWSLVQEENSLEITSPGEEVYVSFQVLSAGELEDAIKEITTYLAKDVPDVELGEPKEAQLNGMPSWSLVGTSKEQEMAIVVTFIKTPADKLMALYAEVTPAAEKFRKEIDAMDQGIKPLK